MSAIPAFARFFAVSVFCVAAACLCGCAGAYTGVSGTSLVRNAHPRVTVTANEPLSLYAYGRQWVSMPVPEFMGFEARGSMDYAVYGEGGGAVTRHAHAIVARPSDTARWRFRPESFVMPGGLHIGRQDVNGYRWTVQLLRVNGETDWFSALWRENGRDVPDVWLARRFSATPDRSTRVVAEYREPWPECLDPDRDIAFVRQGCLDGFLERSDAAFSLVMDGPEALEDAAVPSAPGRPAFAPDVQRLAGELMEDAHFRRWR